MPFFHTCGPNEAMIVSGCCLGKPLLIPGGRVFVWPALQKIQRISLNTMTLVIESPHVYTQMGVSISVVGIAQVKVASHNREMLFAACQQFLDKDHDEVVNIATETLEGHQRAIMGTMTIEVKIASHNKEMLFAACQQFMDKDLREVMHIATETLEGHQRAIMGNMTIEVKIQGKAEEMLRAACQQFLGKNIKEIQKIALETLEGHQRAIMGNMTVEEIYKDRKKFSLAVFDVASTDLINMGITVVSYTLKDIRDEEGYLKALGMARTAQVKRDARIGEAEARRDAGIREAIAEQQRMESRYINDIEIAKCQRDFELKKAVYDQEVNTKKAESDMAYSLQVAKTKQRIKEEQMQIRAAKTKQRIKEEQMQIRVIERGQEIQVQEQEIIRKERELDATVRKPAEAEKYRLEKMAEANRNRIILEAQAEADSIKMKGDAEAFAIEAKANAEAEQMAKKADAWKEYQEAALVDMVLDTLPKVAAEIAAPLSQVKKVTMVSSGQGDVGASKLTNEVLNIMNKLPEVIESMTGINIAKSLGASTRRM